MGENRPVLCPGFGERGWAGERLPWFPALPDPTSQGGACMPRRGRWPACALTADPPWAHGRPLPPEDVRAVIRHQTSFQHPRQQVPRERRGMRQPCQGGDAAGGCARGQQGWMAGPQPLAHRLGPQQHRQLAGSAQAGRTRPSGKSTGKPLSTLDIPQ